MSRRISGVMGGRAGRAGCFVALAACVSCSSSQDSPQEPLPGSAIRRLTRTEYNNTVRDLVGDDSRPADDFPPDAIASVFDNNSDVATVSTNLFEGYERAAEALVEGALNVPRALAVRGDATVIKGTSRADANGFWDLFIEDELAMPVEIVTPGEYELSALAYSVMNSGPPQLGFRVDGRTIGTEWVLAAQATPATYRTRTTLSGGVHTVAVVFAGPAFGSPDERRNLFISHIDVAGPAPLPSVSAARARIISCDPTKMDHDACVRQILGGFASRAFRRPATPDEIEALAALVAANEGAGDGVEDAIKAGLIAILVDPKFLFRPELDDGAPAGSHKVSAYELASRLSYFLWSSMPDDELLATAADGSLLAPEVLEAQARRMIDDAKSDGFVDNFAGQWLFYRGLAQSVPSPTAFPSFDDELRDAMAAETRLVVKDFLHGDHPIADLLVADFTYLNERLARHYGIAGITGAQMRRVPLAGTARRGILSHGSILTVTSNPGATSISKRGRFVLAQLLCAPPPDPIAGVPPLPESPDTMNLTLRQRMEQHTRDPACASCHTVMDPIGFGLEHFDAVGAWRDLDNGKPVDATGRLPGDAFFDGNVQLATVLRAQPGGTQCLTRHLLSFALGRTLVDEDQPAIDRIANDADMRGGRFRDLLLSVLLDRLFSNRATAKP